MAKVWIATIGYGKYLVGTYQLSEALDVLTYLRQVEWSPDGSYKLKVDGEPPISAMEMVELTLPDDGACANSAQPPDRFTTATRGVVEKDDGIPF